MLRAMSSTTSTIQNRQPESPDEVRRRPAGRRARRLSSHLASLVFAALLVATLAPAQTASAAPFSVSGALRTSAGGPVADGKYLVLIRFYDVVNGGQPLFEEAADLDVSAGFFALRVGADPAKPLDNSVLAPGKPLFVAVKVGAEPELPRVPVDAAPRATWAANAAGLMCSGCVMTEAIATGSVTAEKVAFTFAGSDAKGGPALAAVSAQTAQIASLADEANGLACSGCVGLQHLAPNVAQGFVPTQGGKITGTLEVDGTLKLGGSQVDGGVLSGSRLAAVDLKNDACDAQTAGAVGLHPGSASLAYCAGPAGWRLLPGCDPSCPAPESVACGSPITSGCGALVACQGTGSQCPDGLPCNAQGECGSPGQTPALAEPSCKALLAKGIVDDGVYWIDPDGDGDAQPFEAHCDMTTDGGGWTRCGIYDEVSANVDGLVVEEGDAWVSASDLLNKSFCAKWFNETNPAALLVHNKTAGADYGEGEKLVIAWGNSPMTLWSYNNHPIASCKALQANKTFAGCQYSVHQGWGASAWSFTVNGLNSGYSGNSSSRLILGVTAQQGSSTGNFWHNFGADTNPQNSANVWTGVANVGDLYLR